MKKLILCLSCSFVGHATFAQGTINVGNFNSSLVRTNAIAIGGTEGNTAPTLGGFYYGVFTAPSTVTSIDPSLQALLSATWTFTGVYATNTQIVSGGRLNGGSNVPTLAGWPAGVTNSFLVLGWSANIAGQDWNAVAAQLRGATFVNGCWSGPNFTFLSQVGFLGATPIGFGEAGGGTSALPAFEVFGTGPTSQGNPVTTPFDLYVVADCPEPGTLALVCLGVSMVILGGRSRHYASLRARRSE